MYASIPSQPLATKSRGLRRFVIEDLLNLLDHIRRELLEQLDGLDVILDLLDLGGAEDDGADVGVLEGPGEGQRRGGGAEALGDRRQLLHLLDLGLALGRRERLDGALEEVAVVRQPRVLRDAVVVLARQQSRRERRPDGRAVLELLEQRRVLDLEPLPVEGVVLRLLDHGGDEVVPLGDVRRLGDLSRAPF